MKLVQENLRRQQGEHYKNEAKRGRGGQGSKEIITTVKKREEGQEAERRTLQQ